MGRERHGGDLDRHIFPAQFDEKPGAGGREGWRHIADGDRTADRRSKAARTDDADLFAGYALQDSAFTHRRATLGDQAHASARGTAGDLPLDATRARKAAL